MRWDERNQRGGAMLNAAELRRRWVNAGKELKKTGVGKLSKDNETVTVAEWE